MCHKNMKAKTCQKAAMRSFPSGHSAIATALAITLVYVIVVENRGGPNWSKQRRYATAGVITFVALVTAFQRVASGAHYVSDVLVGMFIGAMVAAFSLAVIPGDVVVDEGSEMDFVFDYLL